MHKEEEVGALDHIEVSHDVKSRGFVDEPVDCTNGLIPAGSMFVFDQITHSLRTEAGIYA
ncbi:hypothetical protein ACFL1R_13410 [Candidatus Latescibacterota bacterium]